MRIFLKSLVFLGLLSLSSGCTQKINTYRIAVLNVPTRIDPWNDNETNSNILFSAAFHPFFTLNSNGELESSFFDMTRSRALSTRFSDFQFCIKADARFTDGTPIRTEDVRLAVEASHRYLWTVPEIKSLSEQDDCVVAHLKRPDPRYFNRLSSYNSTVLKKASIGSPVPVGLGPYKIVSLQSDRVQMQANQQPFVGDFRKLEFVKVDPDHLPSESIDDWNMIPQSDRVTERLAGFQTISRPQWKISVLFLSSSSQSKRQSFAKCIDRDIFARATQINIVRTNSLFPQGFFPLLESETPSSEPETCQFSGVRRRLAYYDYRDEEDRLRPFFEQSGNSLPLEVVVEKHTVAETLRDWASGKDMVFRGALTSNEASPEGFVASVNFPTWPKKIEIKGLRELVSAAAAEKDPRVQQQLISRAHAAIISSGTVVPLGQVIGTYRYRPDLYDIIIGNPTLSVPQFHLIKIRPSWQPSLAGLLGLFH